MNTDEYVPSDEDVRSVWVVHERDCGWEPHPGDPSAEFDRFLARVRRDAALHEKQRIAGEVRFWASINDDLGYTEFAETLTRAANDIDRIPEETP